jgi:tetratricopeptide (TPR) repeat protein
MLLFYTRTSAYRLKQTNAPMLKSRLLAALLLSLSLLIRLAPAVSGAQKGTPPLLLCGDYFDKHSAGTLRMAASHARYSDDALVAAACYHYFAIGEPYSCGTLDFEDPGWTIPDALEFADEAGYFDLAAVVREKAIALSKTPVGDFRQDGFIGIIKAVHYLEKTGRTAEAVAMYRNLMATAFEAGVPPSFCSTIMLAYGSFLNDCGDSKDAAPILKELAARCANGIDTSQCYGLAGPSLDGWPDLIVTVRRFQRTGSWAATVGLQTRATPTADDRDWQRAYTAYKALKAFDYGHASQIVAGLLRDEKAKSSHSAYAITRLINIATIYSAQGKNEEARSLLTKLIDLTDGQDNLNTLMHLCAELALLDKQPAAIATAQWKNLEGTLQAIDEAYYATIGCGGGVPQNNCATAVAQFP